MVFRSPSKDNSRQNMVNIDPQTGLPRVNNLIDIQDPPLDGTPGAGQSDANPRPPNNPPTFSDNTGDSNQNNFNLPHGHLYAVNLHLPQFTTDEPEMWFAIAEADFSANRITSDSQKYSQILKSLPIKASKQVWDIISKPPLQNKYGTTHPQITTARGQQYSRPATATATTTAGFADI
ncbi:hypothetical protein KQX54_013143 [Cotesia glomerata]|uniref:DUF7041 domain-containing protein n=1 Tax=Cotesia glomerata TaxID=32391 RepID=A0AAV7IV91_COTGL|nr:hypothetical protein KQX54_013143 [Cotesia glomerata]